MRRVRPFTARRVVALSVAACAALLLCKVLDLARAAGRAAMPAAIAADVGPPAAAPPVSGPAQARPDVRASAPPPPEISESERALLTDLRGRRRELDAREGALAARESTLAAAEQRLGARADELRALQGRLEALDATRRDRDEANWRSLVALYEGMKPAQAAAIFNDLAMPVLLELADRMKARAAAAVLAAMQPERARLLTAELARKRAGDNTPAAAASPGG